MSYLSKGYLSDNFLIALLMSLNDEGLSKDKESAQKKILSMLKNNETIAKSARDKDYVIVDEELEESAQNFFEDEPYENFSCKGVLDDDDLNDYDDILFTHRL